MNKKHGGLLAAVIAVITVVGVGTYNISVDNSTNTNIDSHNQNWFNQIVPNDLADKATLSYICTQDVIPPTHTEKCKEWNGEQ